MAGLLIVPPRLVVYVNGVAEFLVYLFAGAGREGIKGLAVTIQNGGNLRLAFDDGNFLQQTGEIEAHDAAPRAARRLSQASTSLRRQATRLSLMGMRRGNWPRRSMRQTVVRLSGTSRFSQATSGTIG